MRITEGGITYDYDEQNGKTYKNGVLVPQENLRFVPQAAGGTRIDAASAIGQAINNGTGNLGQGSTQEIAAMFNAIQKPDTSLVQMPDYSDGKVRQENFAFQNMLSGKEGSWVPTLAAKDRNQSLQDNYFNQIANGIATQLAQQQFGENRRMNDEAIRMNDESIRMNNEGIRLNLMNTFGTPIQGNTTQEMYSNVQGLTPITMQKAYLSASNRGGSSGSSAAPKLTQTQKKNDLLGSMTSFVQQKAESGVPLNEVVSIIWDNMDATDRQTISLADVQNQVERIYELYAGGTPNGNGEGILGSTDAGSGDSVSYTPFTPNAQGNFASPFDQVITGNKQTLKNLPWYMR